MLLLIAGSVVEESPGPITTADTLIFGDDGAPGSGNGALLRVSNDPTASIVRRGVDFTSSPVLNIGAAVSISGTSMILDSTSTTSLDPAAVLSGDAIALDSGQISLVLDEPGILQPTSGLVLSGAAFASLQQSASSVSLLSYSSLDVYGIGQIGSSAVASLALHAGEIRGFNNDGGTVTFAAQDILLDNSANGRSLGSIDATRGTLVFDANTIHLGGGAIQVHQFADTMFVGSSGIIFQGSGSLDAQGNVGVTTSLLTGATAAAYTLSTEGALIVDRSIDPPAATVSGGLGASLTLIGGSVIENSDILLPSGRVTIQATGTLPGNNLTIGGVLDVSGTAQHFYDLVKYTDGGAIDLTATHGDVQLEAGSIVSVAAQALGGDAGTLTISAPNGGILTNGIS